MTIKGRVFDCFPFNDELEILEIRLNELNDVVDRFILVESTVTQTGIPKPLYFTENKAMFEKFLPKIDCFVLDGVPTEKDENPTGQPEGPMWVRERFQRNFIRECIDGKDGDIVIVSDADEIPRASTVKNYNPEMGIACLDQKLYCYWLNCLDPFQLWPYARIVGWSDFIKTTPHELRYAFADSVDGDGGWHFCFQGGIDRIMSKIHAWAHSIEYNIPEIMDREWIEKAINTPEDVLKLAPLEVRARYHHSDILKFVPIDSSWPKYVTDNMKKFDSWIKKIEA